MSKSFYQKHTLFNLERINAVENIARRAGQPKFIQMIQINGKPVAFLGEKISNIEELLGKFIRIDRMVIPEYVRMVDAKFLQNQLKGNDDDSSVDTEVEGFFYDGQLKEGVLLNVCGLLETSSFMDLHFHNCENRLKNIHILDNSGNGYLTCPDTIISSFLPSDKNDSSEVMGLEHELMLFYISKKDMKKTDEKIKCNPPPPGSNNSENFTIEKILYQYLSDHTYASSEDGRVDPKKIEWNTLKGVFIIPMLFSDKRVVYYCLLNVDDKSNINVPIKRLLSKWLETITNHNANENAVVIAGNDGGYVFIEEWSIFISINNLVKVLPMDLVYEKYVLENRIT